MTDPKRRREPRGAGGAGHQKATARRIDTPAGIDAGAASILLGAAADVVLTLDRLGQVLDLSIPDESLARLIGSGWRGQSWRELVTVESADKIDALLADARAGQAPRWRQVNHAAAGRDDVPVSYAVVALDPPPGNGSGNGRGVRRPAFMALGRDLRPMAQLQRRLVDAQQAMERDYWRFREAETRYRTLFQTATEAVLVADGQSMKVLEANPAAETLFARGPGRLVGLALTTLFDAAAQPRLQALLAAARGGEGRAERVRLRLAAGAGDGEVELTLTLFRQQQSTQLLLRVLPPPSPAKRGAARAAPAPAAGAAALLESYEQRSPDALVFTDAQGRIVRANASFAALVQLTGPELARGELLDRWLGRTGVELDVLLTNLRASEQVTGFATVLRGEVGVEREVEVAATRLDAEGPAALAFSLRDVGRRLETAERPALPIARSPGELSELVGRVPMKDIVAETAEVIEQLCIETALKMTHDNRALAAQFLGLSRQSLYVKLRRYGLGGGDDDGGGD